MHIQTAQGSHYTASEKQRAGGPRQDGSPLKVIFRLHGRLTQLPTQLLTPQTTPDTSLNAFQTGTMLDGI